MMERVTPDGFHVQGLKSESAEELSEKQMLKKVELEALRKVQDKMVTVVGKAIEKLSAFEKKPASADRVSLEDLKARLELLKSKKYSY